MLFTGWVGLMLMYQPFFIGGIDNINESKNSAFGAAGLFFFTFIASVMVLLRDGANHIAHQRGEARRGHGGGRAEYGQVASIEGRFVTGTLT